MSNEMKSYEKIAKFLSTPEGMTYVTLMAYAQQEKAKKQHDEIEKAFVKLKSLKKQFSKEESE